jgi:hypothetical protein
VSERSPRPAKKSPKTTSPVSIYFSAEGAALVGDSDQVRDVRAMLESSDSGSESASTSRQKADPLSDDSDDF